MSDSNNISNHPGPGSNAEPSMEEILASIRRILKEEDSARLDPEEPEDDVFVLSSAMVAAPADISSASALPPEPKVIPANDSAPEPAYHEPVHFASEPELDTPEPAPEADDEEPLTLTASHETFAEDPAPVLEQQPEIIHETAVEAPPLKEQPMEPTVQEPETLIADQVEHAVSNSVGSMIRSIRAERAVSVTHGGLTIEDIVREEIKPMLKAWFDTHLPSLVERVVRAEIGRVIDRTEI